MEKKFVIKLAEDVYIGKEVYKNIFSSLIFEFGDNEVIPKTDPAGNLIFNSEYMSFDKYPNQKQKIFEAANNLYHALNKKYDVINKKIVMDIYYLYEKFRNILEQHYELVLKENNNNNKPAQLDNLSDIDKIKNDLELQKKIAFWNNVKKRWYYVLSWFFVIPGFIFEIFRRVKLKKLSKIVKPKDNDKKEIKAIKYNDNNIKLEPVELYEFAINRQLGFLQASDMHLKILAEKIDNPGVSEKFKNMSVNQVLLSGDESIAVKFVPNDTKNMKKTYGGGVSQTYEINHDKLILQDKKLIYNWHEIGNLTVENNQVILKSELENIKLKKINNNDKPEIIEIYLENKLIGKLNPKKIISEDKNNVFEYRLESVGSEKFYLKQGLLFFDIEHMKKIIQKGLELSKNNKTVKEDLLVLETLLNSLLANEFNNDETTNRWRKRFETPYGNLSQSANTLSAEIWQELFRGNTDITYIRKVIDYLSEIIKLAKENSYKLDQVNLESLLDRAAINTAYDGYLTYAIAKELGTSCIVKTDIVVTEDGYANIMDNADIDKNIDFNVFTHEQQESTLWLNILDYICYNRDHGGWNFYFNKNGICAFDNEWSFPARTFLSKNYKMPDDYLDKIVPFVTKNIKQRVMNLDSKTIEIKMQMFCGTKDLLSDRLNGALERLDNLKKHIEKVKCYDVLDNKTGKILFDRSKGAGCLGQYNSRLNKIKDELYRKKDMDGDKKELG